MNKPKENGCPPSLFIVSSALLWCGATAFGVASPFLALLCLGIAGFGANELVRMIVVPKIERFCKQTDIQINGQYPIVLESEDKEDSAKYVLKLPCGMSIKVFEKYLPELEAFLCGTVTLTADTNKLIIDVCRLTLKREYPYETILCDNEMEICVGYTRKGQYNIDIEEAPHVLVAGTTGGGKSVFLRNIITSLVTQKKGIELNLVDFQAIEFKMFANCSAVKDYCKTPEDFATLLSRMKEESSNRLKEFDRVDCINIKEYNKLNKNKYKYIITIVDEFAVLSEVPEYKPIFTELKLRVAQDRKVGLHYLLCTQRPSAEIISGSIKANIPVRIALLAASGVDSRVVIDEVGAEKLRGKGHALVRTCGLEEIQVMNITPEKAKELCKPFTINKVVEKKKTRTGVVPSGIRKGQKNR